MPNFIYRNDDFDGRGEVGFWKEIHSYFEKAKVNQTIGIVGAGMVGRNTPLIDYIKNTPYWDVQIHCWEHERYIDINPETIYPTYKSMVDWIESTFGKRPTTIFPAWGRVGSGPALEETAEKLNLTVESDAAYIIYYMGAIVNGEDYFKTAVAESNHFIPYSDWRKVYFHPLKNDELQLIKYLVEVTQEIGRGEIDHLDFDSKKTIIDEVRKIMRG